MIQSRKILWDCFRWKAELIRVIDGDTIVVMAQTQHNQFLKAHLRFQRINAPETRGADKVDGLASKKALAELLAGHDTLYLEVWALDSFRRRVAELYIDADDELINVNDALAESGFAAYAKGRGLEEPAGWVVEF